MNTLSADTAVAAVVCRPWSIAQSLFAQSPFAPSYLLACSKKACSDRAGYVIFPAYAKVPAG